MNKLHLTAGLTLSAAAIGLGGNVVGAQEADSKPANILAELPDRMRDEAVDYGVLDCEISPSIVNLLGDNAVKIVQRELSEEGYFRGGIDNKLGKETCKDIHQYQDDKGLFVDGQVGFQVIGSFGLDVQPKPNRDNSTSSPEKASEYTLDDCNDYEKWDKDTIKSVQRSLGVTVDGNFGNESCNAMINFQEENGIASYGKGFLGLRTLRALGVENPEKKTVQATSRTNSRNNGIVDGCKAKYDVDYVFCADTGPGQETGYFYKRNSDGTQTLLKSDEITSSQIDSDGPVRVVDGKLLGNKDSITKKGHFLPSFGQQRSFSLGLKNFISFSGNQGLHYYPDVYMSADSHGCIRLHNSMSDFIYNAVVKYPSRSVSTIDNFEVIIK